VFFSLVYMSLVRVASIFNLNHSRIGLVFSAVSVYLFIWTALTKHWH